MTETPGPETITQGAPPMNKRRIGLARGLMRKQTRLSTEWNLDWIAMLPYCISCREPLIWHTFPAGDEAVLFHCPKCKREWVKGSDWEKDKEENKP